MIKIVEQTACIFQHTGQDSAASIIASVAGTCYAHSINPDRAVEFCLKLLQKGHESPFEFYQLGFSICTSRAVSHELVRHRIASYMQESQRYVSYKECLPVVRPINLPPNCWGVWEEAVESGWAHYCKLLSAGVRKEDARTVLPNSTATNIKVGMNLRAFRNFLRLRNHPTAWVEIRDLAQKMISAASGLDSTITPLIADLS